MSTELLPLFPLHTVLVPGAVLGLRIFEARYLDLVRECTRNGRSFGVCLILSGDEAGTPALPAAFGTEALIEDFSTGDDGLLVLRVRGGRRFHASRLRIRDNGLQVAEVEWLPPDPELALRPEHAGLAGLLRELLNRAGGEHARQFDSCCDDAAWVGWRLAEWLALEDDQRQALLQLDDPHRRLDALLQTMD